MPEIDLAVPEGFTPDTGWDAFIEGLRIVVASNMSAKNPQGDRVEFDPEKDIDVLVTEYRDASSVTAVILAKVITYGWADRMNDIDQRIGRIADYIAEHVGGVIQLVGTDKVSVTFLPKPDKCWAAR